MPRDEIVTALRCCGSYDVNDCKPCPTREEAEKTLEAMKDG